MDRPNDWIWGDDYAASREATRDMIEHHLVDHLVELNDGKANHVMSPAGVRYNICVTVTLECAKTMIGEGVLYGSNR